MKLNIVSGKRSTAQRVVIYGPEGIGKTTLAAQFPSPIFFDLERGSEQMNVHRVVDMTSWTMFMGSLESVLSEDILNTMGAKTIVVDTADAAERLLFDHICASRQLKSIEDFGYGKGYQVAAEEFARFLDSLSRIRDKGFNIVVVAHAMMRKFELPEEMGAYDRWELKLSKKIAPMVKEWADCVLFCNYQTVVTTDPKTKSRKASGNKRVVHTEHSATFDAKNRYGLPAEISLDEVIKVVAPHLSGAVAEAPIVSAPATPTPEQKPIATATQEEKEIPAEGDNTAFNYKLYDLLTADGVTPEQLQKVVAAKGYYPESVPIDNYDEEFVNGCLIPCWAQIKALIK